MLDSIGRREQNLLPQVFLKRYKDLQYLMLEKGSSAHIIRDDLNICYLTGANYYSMERPVLLVAFADSPAILVVPKMEEAHLQGLENIDQVVVQETWSRLALQF